MQLDVIHNRASFNKYMEKCVKMLIEYLATKRNLHSQFVLALQWYRLAQTATPSNVPLNRQQINRLFEMILKQFIVTATTYVQLNSRNAAKSKAFGYFFQNLYELYNTCAVELRRTTSFLAYSKLMITSYRLYDSENSDGSSTATTTVAGHNDDDDEFQKALDFGGKKMNEKVQLQSDKNAKKTESTKGGTQQTQKK